MNIYHNFPLSEVLWYKIGGRAKYFLTAETRDDVLRSLDFIDKNPVQKIFICGLGSNLIFSDDYFDGAVIQIADTSEGERDAAFKKEGYVEVFAGTILDDLLQLSF